MNIEELSARFETALEAFNVESKKRGLVQNVICCNDYGIFINFEGVEVKYSLYSLGQELGAYLPAQVEKHENYARLLQRHKLQAEKELKILNSSLYGFLQHFLKPSEENLDEIIGRESVKVAFDKVLKEGALLGKYFFEEIVSDYTKTRLDNLRKKASDLTKLIYHEARELESLDVSKLQYFKNKKILWYEKLG